MFKRVLVLAMVVGAVVLAGCDEKGGESSGRVAVVDLDKIADQIGQKSKLEEARQVRERNLQLRVRVLQQNVQAKLVGLAQEIGKRPEAKVPTAPTDGEKKVLVEWTGKMQNLERARLDATNKIRQLYNQQRQVNQKAMGAEITKIRDRIKPLAQRIARDKGLDVVLMTPAVLVYDESVDITQAVFNEVNELLKAGNFPTVTNVI
jgi:Skp family chaperone for outer membrane proteins